MPVPPQNAATPLADEETTIPYSDHPTLEDRRTRVVHVLFKTHLDIGFTNLAGAVVEQYMTHYIPAAIELARTLRERGGADRFVWTTGSWLIYEYLERASPPQRERMEEAIAAGDIAWHGLPFTTHSELVEPSLFQEGLRIARDLDRRFGKRTIAAKMTDVPGHTRGIIPLLAEAGIRFLHIGVNPASTAPDVPPVFVWRDPSGAEVIVMYDKGSYGATTVVPDHDEAIVFAHTGDNHGPQSAADVGATFQRLRERFPRARVEASTLDRFAEALARIKATLPVVTEEFGDTWIHGVGSDPMKVARYRELARLRREWLTTGQARVDDSAIIRFSRALLLVPEHTWGLDVKTFLADDTNYETAAFQAARRGANYQVMEESWAEQRAYIDTAVAALDDGALERQARERLAALTPVRLDMIGWEPVAAGATEIETAHFTLRIDPWHGALSYLQAKGPGRIWASDENPLALISYETFSADDYDRFYDRYVVAEEADGWWARADFTKPGLKAARPEHRVWRPRLSHIYRRRDARGEALLLLLEMPDESAERYGAPRRLALTYDFPRSEPIVRVTLRWFNKQACRLPEALWLSFTPIVRDDGTWLLEKMGQPISPLDVVRDGARTLHAVDRGVSYGDAEGRFSLDTLDAPLVALGAPSLLQWTNELPALDKGMSVNLYNNVWGTNFPQWYDEDAAFRFTIGVV